jgi:hypothetical protein
MPLSSLDFIQVGFFDHSGNQPILFLTPRVSVILEQALQSCSTQRAFSDCLAAGSGLGRRHRRVTVPATEDQSILQLFLLSAALPRG